MFRTKRLAALSVLRGNRPGTDVRDRSGQQRRNRGRVYRRGRARFSFARFPTIFASFQNSVPLTRVGW